MDNRFGDTRRFVRVMVCTRELFVHYPANMDYTEAKEYALETANENPESVSWGVPKCDTVLITPDGRAERARWKPAASVTAYDPPIKV